MKRVKFLTLTLCGALLVSCGGDKKTAESTDTVAPDSTATAAATEETATQAENTFTVEGTDQMTYNVTELKAKAGKPITITFKNVGKQAKSIMGHDLIVLKEGTNVDEFGKVAILAKATDYIPASGPEADAIIAHTKLLGPGESDTITFTIDKPGTYDYICSFPGHYALMKGKLIVE
ncbi:MAG: azurin [Flavobacteriaceae bacterium]|jgi:azurin|nr:azurin [Flavobacteriaceae bacterium]